MLIPRLPKELSMVNRPTDDVEKTEPNKGLRYLERGYKFPARFGIYRYRYRIGVGRRVFYAGLPSRGKKKIIQIEEGAHCR